jgi:hypothetical protein
MSNLQGQPGEVRMTIQIKRKETGETETHELVGKVTDCQTGEECALPSHTPHAQIQAKGKAQGE